MTKLLEKLGMDTAVMTGNDWLGVFFTIAVFAGMVYVYALVFNPANKEKFESRRGMALDDEDQINPGEMK